MKSFAPCVLTATGGDEAGFELSYDEYKQQLPRAFEASLSVNMWSEGWGDGTQEPIERDYNKMRDLGHQLRLLDACVNTWLPDFEWLLRDKGIFRHHRTNPESDKGDFATLISQSREMGVDDYLCNPNNMVAVVKIYRTHGISYEDWLRSTSTVAAVHSYCLSRRLFISHRGLMGLAHDAIRDQDEIWALAGSKVPIILRPKSDGCYEWLGEAYVDGMMFGELWPADESSLREVMVV